jgi:hypothetical protein
MASQAGQRADPGTAPEALIKEARRHQRRRYLIGGLAVLGAAAAVCGALAGLSRASHPRPPGVPRPRAAAIRPARPAAVGQIPASTDTTLLLWPVGYPGFSASGGPPAYVDNLSTGRLTESESPDISAGDYQPLLSPVGTYLVYVGGDGTTAIRDDLTGRPHLVGGSPSFAPSATPGQVWLLTRNGNVLTARPAPVAGGRPGPPLTLPAGTELLIRGTDAGLLLEVSRPAGFGLALWHPGAAPRILPYAAAEDITYGFDATALLIAYGTGCTDQVTAPGAALANADYQACAMLRILSVVTGTLSSFAAPPGTAGWVPDEFNLVSAISGQNQMIAAYAAVPPQGSGRVRLYVIRLTSPSPRASAVPSSGALLFARTAWSTNGSWLLYQGPGGHLWAYQLTSGQTRASSTPCCQYTVMAAVPSHPG